ncbi:MAG: protein-methionine-sulfoxide reductase heme-binding subunit MsrQ [Sulfitobacter sp.]
MSVVDRLNTALRRVPILLVYIVCAAPAPWLFYLGVTGGLGVEPIKALEHELGQLALKFLIVALAVTPLRRFTGLNLIRFRRAIGLIAFYYALCHLLVWVFLDVQIVSEMWGDILKRPYVTIGMLGFAVMLPLAITSNNWSVRRLGVTWRKLHKLTYVVAFLGGLHFVMLAKGFQIEPLLYMAAILGLLALRFPNLRRKRSI